jgi:hypothetical protein
VYQVSDGIATANATASIQRPSKQTYTTSLSGGGTGNEDGPQTITLTITISPPALSDGIAVPWTFRDPEPDYIGETPVPDFLTSADLDQWSGTVSFNTGEFEKTITLTPVDDTVVELNESGDICIPLDQLHDGPDYKVITLGGGDVSAKVLDDEWRWEPVVPDGTNVPGVIDSHGETIEIHNHPILGGFLSYLVGTYVLKKNLPIPDNGIEGPNSFTVAVNGTFRDGGLFGWTSHSLPTQSRTFDFNLDSQTGHISQAGGGVSTGGGTVDPSGLTVAVFNAAAVIDNVPATIHTVTMEVGGDVGVEGSWSVGGSGVLGTVLGGAIDWTGNYSWSANLGVWYSVAELRAIRGATN